MGQAQADYSSIARVIELNDATTYCHAIAKCQQATEKAVKAVVRSLGMQVGRKHDVLRLVDAILLAPGPRSRGRMMAHVRGLFGPQIRADIQAIDRLAPKYPAPGQHPQRNTEYPYQEANGDWRYPALAKSFSREEFDRFRAAAHRVVMGAARIVSAVARTGI
jgi:hypothetical protein